MLTYVLYCGRRACIQRVRRNYHTQQILLYSLICTGSEPGPSSASKNADSTEGEVLYMQAEFASYIYVNIFFCIKYRDPSSC